VKERDRGVPGASNSSVIVAEIKTNADFTDLLRKAAVLRKSCC
jgi:hypothetical protein